MGVLSGELSGESARAEPWTVYLFGWRQGLTLGLGSEKRGSVGHVGAPGGNWSDLRGAALRLRLRLRVDLEIS